MSNEGDPWEKGHIYVFSQGQVTKITKKWFTGMPCDTSIQSYFVRRYQSDGHVANGFIKSDF